MVGQIVKDTEMMCQNLALLKLLQNPKSAAAKPAELINAYEESYNEFRQASDLLGKR